MQPVPAHTTWTCCPTSSLESHGLQVLVGDLVYITDRSFVTSLNQHLDGRGSTEGDFYYISEVAARLTHLQKKKKAQKFQADLESFSETFGISIAAFSQWQAVMNCKAARDRFVHSVTLTRSGIDSLKDALANQVAILEPCKDAVSAMLIVGQHFKVI